MWQKIIKVGKQYLMTLSLVLLSAVALASFFSSTDNRQIFAGLENKMSATSVGDLGAASSTLSGFAWSSNIGWISMSGTTTLGTTYGVNIQSDGSLVGYAWSDNIGWIKFGGLSGCSPSLLGCDAKITSNWTLSGWARACAGTQNGDCNTPSRTDGWDGWISLSSANGIGGGAYGITFSSTTLAAIAGSYAWGSDVVGWISWKPAFGGVVITSENKNCFSPKPTPTQSFDFGADNVAKNWKLITEYPRTITTLGSCEYGCNNGYNGTQCYGTSQCQTNPLDETTRLPIDPNIVSKSGFGYWKKGATSTNLGFCEYDCKVGWIWNGTECIKDIRIEGNCIDKPSPSTNYIFSAKVHIGLPSPWWYDVGLDVSNTNDRGSCGWNCNGVDGYTISADKKSCIYNDGICGEDDLITMVGSTTTVNYAGKDNHGLWAWVSTTTFAGTPSPECIFTCKDGYSYNSTTNKCETGPDPITGGCKGAKPITGPGTGVLVSPDSMRQASTSWDYLDYDLIQSDFDSAGNCRWGCGVGYLPGVNKNCYRTGTTTQK